MTLFYRLWLSLAATLGVLIMALGVGEFQTLKRALSSEVDRDLEQRAHWVERQLRSGRVPEGLMVPERQSLEEIGKLFVEIFDSKGSLVARSSNLEGQPLPGQREPGTDFQTVVTPAQHPFRIFHLASSDGYQIRVGQTLELAHRSLGNSLAAFLLMGLAGLTVAAMVSFRLLWRICAPLSALALKAAEIANGGNVSERLHAHNDMVPEVLVLSQTVNQLLARVEQLLEAQSRLLQDTSHELRNPLGVLELDLDLLVRHDLDERSRNEVGVEARGELNRLIRLVEDLLEISWAERVTRVQVEAVNLAHVLRPLLASYHARCEGRTLELVGPDLRVLADERRLGQIMRNLVDNAFRYAGPKAHIRVVLCDREDAEKLGAPGASRLVQGDSVLLVEDDGPGIDRQYWEQVFERFYRLESDRNRLQGGTGLGLPVARALARAMGGDLWIDNRTSKGACFWLRLRSA